MKQNVRFQERLERIQPDQIENGRLLIITDTNKYAYFHLKYMAGRPSLRLKITAVARATGNDPDYDLDPDFVQI